MIAEIVIAAAAAYILWPKDPPSPPPVHVFNGTVTIKAIPSLIDDWKPLRAGQKQIQSRWSGGRKL
jgi:hypothetical protein